MSLNRIKKILEQNNKESFYMDDIKSILDKVSELKGKLDLIIKEADLDGETKAYHKAKEIRFDLDKIGEDFGKPPYNLNQDKIREVFELAVELSRPEIEHLIYRLKDYMGRFKKSEEAEVASPDGTLSDLGELPKFNYGTVDARGGSKKDKNPKKIKKKKDNTYETEEEFDFYPKNVKGWRDKWDEVMKTESLNETIYPRIVKVEKLEEDPEYIFEDEDKNIKAILNYLKVDSNVDFLFIKEDEDDIIVYGGNGNPEPNKEIHLIERK